MLKQRIVLAILIPGIILFLSLGYSVRNQPSSPVKEVTSSLEQEPLPLSTAPSATQSFFTIRPMIMGSGDEVTIYGGWPNQKEYRIYIANNSEKYLVGKGGFNGGIAWNGVVEKNLKTLDGKEVDLPLGAYHFPVYSLNYP